MKIMEHVLSGLAALKVMLEGNDAAIVARVHRDLNSLSLDAHNAEFPEDHDHEAAHADAAAARDVAAVAASQLQDHLDRIEAAPRAVNPAPVQTDEDLAAHMAQMQPGKGGGDLGQVVDEGPAGDKPTE